MNRFIIRVYGIVVNRKGEVLLTDEFRMGMQMTKFPGGGLKFGEGPVDCLKREAREEFGQEIEIIDHFYTTDYFQEALFYPGYQLISIYYLFRFRRRVRFRVSDNPFDFPEMIEGMQSFRWVPVKDLDAGDVSFPVDRKVVQLLKEKMLL